MKERKIIHILFLICVLMLLRLWLVFTERAAEQEAGEDAAGKVAHWEDTSEDAAAGQDELEKDVSGEGAAEEDATGENVSEKDAAEKDASEENASEKDAVEEDTSEEDVLEKDTAEEDTAKTVYLTFDDGPSKNTGKVLDVLSEYGIKATFFVIGKDLTEEGIESLKRAVSEGHAIGMHTYSHDYKEIYASVESFLADYDMLRESLTEWIGYSPTMFRFPGGSCCMYNKAIREALIEEMTERGYVYYDWNVSAEDSVGKVTAYSIRKNIFPRVYEVSSPVILMHDSASNSLTAELLPEIIETLLAEGYSFATLYEREPLHFR